MTPINWLLTMLASVLVCCSIDPPAARFSCAAGEACPPQQVCGSDGFCRAENARFDASSGWMEPDAETPTGENQLDAAAPLPDASVITADGGACGACGAATPVCEDGQCRECARDAKHCQGDTPVWCSADHRWIKQSVCSGRLPACNAGVCGAVRLRGGLYSTPVLGGATPNQPRLVDAALGIVAACGPVKGESVCVVGGIAP
jgi:hypothetical protein